MKIFLLHSVLKFYRGIISQNKKWLLATIIALLVPNLSLFCMYNAAAEGMQYAAEAAPIVEKTIGSVGDKLLNAGRVGVVFAATMINASGKA